MYTVHVHYWSLNEYAFEYTSVLNDIYTWFIPYVDIIVYLYNIIMYDIIVYTSCYFIRVIFYYFIRPRRTYVFIWNARYIYLRYCNVYTIHRI